MLKLLLVVCFVGLVLADIPLKFQGQYTANVKMRGMFEFGPGQFPSLQGFKSCCDGADGIYEAVFDVVADFDTFGFCTGVISGKCGDFPDLPDVDRVCFNFTDVIDAGNNCYEGTLDLSSLVPSVPQVIGVFELNDDGAFRLDAVDAIVRSFLGGEQSCPLPSADESLECKISSQIVTSQPISGKANFAVADSSSSSSGDEENTHSASPNLCSWLF
eukprot:TRINITY_DN21654_c0_g1_i2.p1 TRINITY_DN21654_c0_g1~~TRINITY_DN21654_c0_g1_i2.p1  ORF type:complete len:216 (+),score=27.39 TRINITY_DN21654_c0_g1_i2:83-730(+)